MGEFMKIKDWPVLCNHGPDNKSYFAGWWLMPADWRSSACEDFSKRKLAICYSCGVIWVPRETPDCPGSDPERPIGDLFTWVNS